MTRPDTHTGDGVWLTRANGEREWIEAPRCACGGEVEMRQVKPMDEAVDDEVIAEIVCLACSKVQVRFHKPSQAAIERGRELAERYGW